MELWILFGVFTLLMLIGTPIAFCLGIASFATVVYMGLPALVVFQQLNSGMSVFSLLAIPFFIYSGDLMVRGGIAQRIVNFAASLVGHVRGGLGQVNIVTATLFGGISGSAVAEAAAVGGLMIPQMKARGYGADYAVNVTSMAALIALLLPPSHNMIIYSISAGGKISIADLFTAGVIPAFMQITRRLGIVAQTKIRIAQIDQRPGQIAMIVNLLRYGHGLLRQLQRRFRITAPIREGPQI